MAGLTAGAMAVVAFLAYQASAHVPATLGTPPVTSPSARPSGSPAETHRDPLAVPALSGEGTRVVYSLGERRVWLVPSKGQHPPTFPVMPSTVSPAPGTYTVTSRTDRIQGSDGVPIEHVVRFAKVDNVTIGFSAATDGSMQNPDISKKTGGVRMKRADGNAMWTFAGLGTKVVVVP
ncbi:hypothetical protein [Streptomyces sp. NPDC059176]|uniref:hypothetical protein n=1 Tax=unclassified Streptomyces TaxID=2593676 RepID=UPI00369D3CEB